MSRRPGQLAVDGETFARAWLAVSVATSTDAARPVLCRTTLVEWYRSGARLVATDGTIIALAWVPAKGARETPLDIDEAPLVAVLASDVDGRGASLFKHVASITKGDEALPVDLHLSVRDADLDGAQLPLSADLAASTLCVDLESVERVMLHVVEGQFPSWRGLLGELPAPTPADHVTLSQEMHTRLGEIAKRLGVTTVRSSMRGENGAVSFTTGARDFAVSVSGAYMPVRSE